MWVLEQVLAEAKENRENLCASVKKGTIMVIYSKKEIKKDSVGNHVADVILLWDLCR